MSEWIAYGSLAKRIYEQAFEGMRTHFEMNQAEADVLMFLFNHPACTTAREIETLRGLSKSVVSSALDHLWRRGYVSRLEDTADRRVVRLSLTQAAGEAAAAGVAAQRAFLDRLLQGFTQEERLHLEGDLLRICRNLSDAYREGTNREKIRD